MTTNEELNRILRRVGNDFGYKEVTGEFAAYRDFKMKWSRPYKWINFQIADCLENAPENVIEGISRCVFEKITRKGDGDCLEEVTEWLTSEEFVKENQETYIRRCRGFSSPEVQNHNLMESYRRLIDIGLTVEDPMMTIG